MHATASIRRYSGEQLLLCVIRRPARRPAVERELDRRAAARERLEPIRLPRPEARRPATGSRRAG